MAEYNSSEIHWPFVSFQNLNSLYFTYFFVRVHSFYHSLSITVTHCIFFCYSLSFVVTLCHSLPLVATLLPLLVPLVTCCTTCRHSLLLVVNRCSTRCQSLYYSLSLVITDVPLVCLFINDHILRAISKSFDIILLPIKK